MSLKPKNCCHPNCFNCPYDDCENETIYATDYISDEQVGVKTKDKARKGALEYYYKNREKILERQRQKYAENPQKYIQRNRKRYQENREEYIRKQIERNKRYKKKIV